MVHFGTLIAVLWVFRYDLITLIRRFFVFVTRFPSKNLFKDSFSHDPELRLIGLIVVATIPTALIGYFFKNLFEALFSSVFAVGVSLMLTGTLLLLTRRTPIHHKTIKDMTTIDALVIGLSQGIAITPGISRSGATISTALFLGIDRELAGRFSFLIFIPAILGAIILNVTFPALPPSTHLYNVFAGTLAASITGYFALRVLLRFVKKGKLYIFSSYVYGVGLFTILFDLLH